MPASLQTQPKTSTCALWPKVSMQYIGTQLRKSFIEMYWMVKLISSSNWEPSLILAVSESSYLVYKHKNIWGNQRSKQQKLVQNNTCSVISHTMYKGAILYTVAVHRRCKRANRLNSVINHIGLYFICHVSQTLILYSLKYLCSAWQQFLTKHILIIII